MTETQKNVVNKMEINQANIPMRNCLLDFIVSHSIGLYWSQIGKHCYNNQKSLQKQKYTIK